MCASTPLNCNDGNVCTIDICNPLVGCQHPPVLSGTCDDHNGCTLNDTCVAGGCSGFARNCSDGNLCNGLETCDRTTGQCDVPTDELLCTPGSKRPTSCNAEWYADVPNNPKGVMSTVKECRQGDASCDHDTDPLTCTFRIGVCFHLSDPRLSIPCLPGSVSSYRLQRPTLSTSAAATATMMNALLALPGASLSPMISSMILYSPPLTQIRCTADLPIVVPAGKKFKVRGRTVTSVAVDTDGMLLFCRK